MLVSVFADASFDPETRAGGFGCWSKSLRGRHSGGAPFKSLARNNVVAEMMACLNAAHLAFVHLIAYPGDTILIQTDCTPAIAAFEGRRILQEDEQVIVDGLRTLLQIKSATVRWKHVKAHTNGDQPRLWVNNHCDHLAKQGMREARAQARSKGLPELLTRPKSPKPNANERSKKRETRRADRMLDQNNRRTFAFGFNEEEWKNYVMDPGLSSIPPWEKQEPAQQPVAGHDLGVSHAA
jgi:ribonuclease HI